MTPAQSAIDAAFAELSTLKEVLSRARSKQVTSDDQKRTAKATALTWFHTRRPAVAKATSDEHVQPIDRVYQELIAFSAKAALKSKYLKTIGGGLKQISLFQIEFALQLAKATVSSDDLPHRKLRRSSRLLAVDQKMEAILIRRWNECVCTVSNGAPLSAVVMMGGLLEALLLAWINKLSPPDRARVVGAASAPKDSKTGRVLDIRDWMLKSYIDVAHELSWISTSAKDVGVVLRDYRNYVHPHKEYSHGSVLTLDDARVLWDVA